MEKRIEQFKAWAKTHGWPAELMESPNPGEWKAGLRSVFELWSDGWIACERSKASTLVWDD